MRAPGSHATAISQISVKFCQFKGSTQNSVGKLFQWYLTDYSEASHTYCYIIN